MKDNRSLAISSKIQQCKMGNIIGLLEKEFPSSILQAAGSKQSRNRVFSANNTLLTMVLTATQQDKTLKNSVDLYYMIHQQHKQQILEDLQQQAQHQKQLDQTIHKKAGRPKKYRVQISKSLNKDISLNTAAYSKARERVPLALVQALFDASHLPEAPDAYTHWHDYRVLIGDGTYVQMQDVAEIRKDYQVKHGAEASDAYPQGLLEVIIERGSGQLYSFKLSNRHVSELELFYWMLDDLPPRSILLLDDLYNCFEIIAKCVRLGIQMVVPSKRERNYEVVEVLGPGDEIIRIKTPKNRSKWLKENEKPTTILLRRIVCKSPDGTTYVLNTTVTDKTIEKEEIQVLYVSRWDIEIGIREIKTIMDVNILRAKTPDMALKELTVALATYNLIRKIIYASIKDLPFPPKEDFIQQFYTNHQDILIDKKGRIYNRWSTGRRRTEQTDTKGIAAKTNAKQKI